jgi:hypothetical protein
LLLICAAYAPVFWGDVIFFRDPAHWNYPARAFIRSTLLNGEFPHWNPYQGLGVSVWGNPLYGTFYPPNWVLLLVPERLLINALTVQSLAHTIWGAWGALLLARRFGCTPVACLTGGLAWGLCGYTTGMWSAGLLLIANAWVPWVAVGFIVAFADACAKQWSKAIVKTAAPLSLSFLAGEVFISLMAIGFGALTTIAWRVQDCHGNSPLHATLRRSIAPILAGVALSMGIASIVIVPARADLAETGRAKGVPIEHAERYSLHPLRMIEVVAPQAMGAPTADYPGGKIVGEASIDGMPLSPSVYLGAVVVFFAAFALGRGRNAALLLLAFLLFALVLSAGRHTPIHGVWRRVMLPFLYMRYPEKYAVMVFGWACLLCSIGVDRAVRSATGMWGRLMGLIGGLVVVAFLAPFLLERDLVGYIWNGAVHAAVALVVVAALLLLRSRAPRPILPLLVAVVFVDLVRVVWTLQIFQPADAVTQTPLSVKEIGKTTAAAPSPPRLYRAHKVGDAIARQNELNDARASARGAMSTISPNLNVVFAIGGVPGYDAASSQQLGDFWYEGLKFGDTTLRLLAVEFAMLPVKDPGTADKRERAFVPLIDPLPGVRLYKVKNPLPRVYIAGSSAVVDDRKALYQLFTPEVADGGLALIAEGQGAAALKAEPSRAGNCRVETYRGSRLDAVCTAKREGIAVFVEQFNPGWQATVDGVPRPVLRVNHLLRGVSVPLGTHRVTMSFRPPGLTAGLLMSGFSLALLLGCAVIWAGGSGTRWFRSSLSPPKER